MPERCEYCKTENLPDFAGQKEPHWRRIHFKHSKIYEKKVLEEKGLQIPMEEDLAFCSPEDYRKFMGANRYWSGGDPEYDKTGRLLELGKKVI